MTKNSREELFDFVENLQSLYYRSILVLVGTGSKNNLPDLHSRLSKTAKLNDIVWCYKNVETEKDKEMKKIKLDEDDDNFLKWIKIYNPEYILYRDSNRILGRTYDLLILEDFEAITPNILAMCVETVKGGGLIIFLFEQEKSINEIISKRSDLIDEITFNSQNAPRFNRRLFKLLLNTDCAIFLDEKLRLLNKSHLVNKRKLNIDSTAAHILDKDTDCPLIKLCKTVDQRNVLKKCLSLIEKNEPSIASILASRGRGKSASLGFAVAKAVEMGFSSIFLSALFLENIQTLFEHIILGFKSMGYKNITDYKITYSFEKKRRLISRIDILRTPKQSIEYFHPFQNIKYYPNLLVIDEAASIPLNYLKVLLDVKFIFLASTVSGYEGTGRIFSTRLQEYIAEKSLNLTILTMDEPIRYALGDPAEKWLNESLLLESPVSNIDDCPIPTDCMLMHVNKDLLFSGSSKSELFLKELFSLFIASHYRNSPNDLQILSDSQNHEAFVLLTTGTKPKIACAMQIAFEGRCDKNAKTKIGNLIPWVLYDNYFDDQILSSFGVRIVRIATHPNLLGMGYGTVALESLIDTFSYKIELSSSRVTSNANANANVLLNSLDKINLPKIDWIGTSFGIKENLLNFWKKSGFYPICIKQSPSKTTGEFSTVAIKTLNRDLMSSFLIKRSIFLTRFLSLLPISFKVFSPSLVLSLIYSPDKINFEKEIKLTEDEKMRCKLFSKGILDVKNISEVIGDVFKLAFFNYRLSNISILEQSILIMYGLQFKSVNEIANCLDVEEFRVINILVTAMQKVVETSILD